MAFILKRRTRTMLGLLNRHQAAALRSAPLSQSLQKAAIMPRTFKTISAKDAPSLDLDLVKQEGFSIDQLMELAGLSVSQAVYRVHPPSKGANILVGCGPGNNGGDGLVAARHLAHYGYKPIVYHPKHGQNEVYPRLRKQLESLRVPFTTDFKAEMSTTDLVVDAFFGFSFKGPLREPFTDVISAMENSSTPVFSVDAPSSWEIETGPPSAGQPGAKFLPEYLISLTAPKPLIRFFRGRHFLGGRFLSPALAQKYNLDIPEYPGSDQILEAERE